MDAAINHYIEAGAYAKAIESAIEARLWNKAVQYIDILDLEVALPFYVRLARHFEDSRLFEEAEKYYVRVCTCISARASHASIFNPVH